MCKAGARLNIDLILLVRSLLLRKSVIRSPLLIQQTRLFFYDLIKYPNYDIFSSEDYCL